MKNTLVNDTVSKKFRKSVVGLAIVLGSLVFIMVFISLVYYSINFRVRRSAETSLAREKAKLNIVSVTEAYFRPIPGDTDAIDVTVKTPMRVHVVFVFLYYNGSAELKKTNYVIEGQGYFIVDNIAVASGDELYEISVKLVTAEGAIIPASLWIAK